MAKTVKLVRYNGKKDSYSGCSSPENLVKGQVYMVISRDIGTWQTNYTLEGVEGYYNSVWFDTVEEYEESLTNMAISKNKPQVGLRAQLLRVVYSGESVSLQNWRTSTVQEVKHLTNNLYQIKTRNNLYIVQVI